MTAMTAAKTITLVLIDIVLDLHSLYCNRETKVTISL